MHKACLLSALRNIFILDEYVGVGVEDFRSLYGWLRGVLFTPLRITAAQITPLPGDAATWLLLARTITPPLSPQGALMWRFWAWGRTATSATTIPPAAATATTRVLDLSESSLATCARRAVSNSYPKR